MIDIQLVDCLEGLRALDDQSVDYVFADPPYGINLQPQFTAWAPVPNDDLTAERYEAWIGEVLGELRRVLKPNTAMHLCAGWSTADVVMRALRGAAFTIKGCVVWAKDSPGLGWHLRRQHEFVFLAFKGAPPKPARAPSDAWHISRVPGRRLLHICQKPEELVERAMLVYTKPGDLVLDPFCGSGTTPAVAQRLGRRCLAMEVDPEVYRVAVARVAPNPGRLDVDSVNLTP